MSLIQKLPHRRMEAWRWTDVQRAVPEGMTGLSTAMTPRFTPPQGISIVQDEGHSSDSIMGKLAQNFAGPCWTIDVPADAKPADSLLIEDMAAGHSRVAVIIGAGAELTLVEYHKGGAGTFANIDVDIQLGKGAKLIRVMVQNDPDDMTRIATATVTAKEGARFEQYILSFGGALTRLETRLYGQGEGIEAVMNGAYLLSGKKHTDMTSHTQLSHPNCHIRQSVKGVVTDKAKGVFQGKFHVERAAQHTDAEMRHDALMLSDRCEIRAKPELEIYADDVACAHGNTIGALDENALFYMRQRGIPMAQAKAMLTEAFVISVFDDLGDEDMKASLTAQISKWLETSYGV